MWSAADKISHGGAPRGIDNGSGNAEVRQLEPPILGDHDVRRFQVAMHYFAFVRVIERFAKLQDIRFYLRPLENAVGLVELDGVQVGAFHVFQADKRGSRPATGRGRECG